MTPRRREHPLYRGRTRVQLFGGPLDQSIAWLDPYVVAASAIKLPGGYYMLDGHLIWSWVALVEREAAP